MTPACLTCSRRRIPGKPDGLSWARCEACAAAAFREFGPAEQVVHVERLSAGMAELVIKGRRVA